MTPTKLARCRIALAPLLLLVVDPRPAAGQEASPSVIAAQSALIDVVEQIEVPARTAGVLATVERRDGDRVEAGRLLASIDSSEAVLLHQRALAERDLSHRQAQSDVAIRFAAKAQAYARSQQQRLKRASDELPGSVSRSELDESLMKAAQADLDLEQARHEHDIAALDTRLKEADCAIAKHRIGMCQIVAPINGVVVEVLRHRGEWVEPGDAVMRLMRTDRLQADGLVNIADVTTDLLGAKADVKVSLPVDPELETAGQIVFVSPDINPVSGHLRVRVEFDNPSGEFRPGMRATMMIYPAAGAAAPRPALTTTTDPLAP